MVGTGALRAAHAEQRALAVRAGVLEIDALPEVVVRVLVYGTLPARPRVECAVRVVPHALQQRVAAEAEVAGHGVDVAAPVARTEAVAGLCVAFVAGRVPVTHITYMVAYLLFFSGV